MSGTLPDEVSTAPAAPPSDGVLGRSHRLLRRAMTSLRSRGLMHQDDRTVERSVRAPLEQLPPRYRDGHSVSRAPMGQPAGLVYDADGRVAWDRIWGDFCDLALAGGPPHRATMLRAPRTLRAADRTAQDMVLGELERGLSLTTGWPTTRAVRSGRIGLVCPDADAAGWMAIAIRAENVDVERDEATLALPAGPAFRHTHEIKNVVTAVAKAHHYWVEHSGLID